MILFRFEGVYQYCIDTYGAAFVEKYIGNPLSSKQVKQLAGKAIVYTASVVAVIALDITDQNYRDDKYHKEMDIAIEKRQKLNLPITSDIFTEMEDKIRKENLTIFKQARQSLRDFGKIDLKKKK
jgi:nucleoside-specific outer membrane channel protein Tsx